MSEMNTFSPPKHVSNVFLRILPHQFSRIFYIIIIRTDKVCKINPKD
nr:MAG TPA: hypothetical protein [Caudoviricetes sp.]